MRRSMGQGAGNGVTGDRNIAIGIQSGSGITANVTVSIGDAATASADYAIAMGAGAQALGASSISIGTGNVVSGANSGAIGDPTTITGSGTYSLGNNNGTIGANESGVFGNNNTLPSGSDNSRIVGNGNTVNSANVMVMGNGVSVATGLDGAVVLGDGSTVVASTPTSIGVINGVTYNYAGGAPTPGGVVSVGAVGAERQIQNVAAGQVTATSTDAINGSQLYSTNQAIENVAGKLTHYYSVNDGGIVGGNYNNDGATGVNSLAAGVNASATAAQSTAVGYNASATAGNSTALGYLAQAGGLGSFAAGANAQAIGDFGVAIGENSQATYRSVAIGHAAGEGSTGTVNTLIGAGAGLGLTGNSNVALGEGAAAAASGNANIVSGLGAFQSGTGNQNIASGAFTGIFVTGSNNVLQGSGAGMFLSGDNNLAIGKAAGTGYYFDSVTGTFTDRNGNPVSAIPAPIALTDAIAIGNTAITDADRTVALGRGTLAGAADAIALGTGAQATASAGDVALGSGSVTAAAVGTASTTINGTTYNFAGTAPLSTVSVGDVGAERTITNVAAGRISATSTDAINGSQLFATNQAIENVTGKLTHYYSVNDGGVAGGNYNNDGATGFNSIAAGVDATADGDGGVAMGNAAIARGRGATAIGQNAETASGTSAGTAIGVQSFAGGVGASAIGSFAHANGFLSSALGATAMSFGDTSVGVGMGVAGGQSSAAIGGGMLGNMTLALDPNDPTNSTVTGEAYGRQLTVVVDQTSNPLVTTGTIDGKAFEFVANPGPATNNDPYANIASGTFDGQVLTQAQAAALFMSMAQGSPLALGDGSVAAGPAALAGADYSIAQGYHAMAFGEGDVALGANSYADGAVGTASAVINGTTYTFAGTTPVATVSVGDVGAERTISNVAAGRISGTSTDAINGSQLYATNQAIENATGKLTHYYSVNDGDVVGGNVNNDGATGKNAIAAGVDAAASGDGALAMGYGANAQGIDSIAQGTGAVATGQGAVGLGYQSQATQAGSLALGDGAQATVSAGDVALGSGSVTAVAIGTAGVTIRGTTYAFAGATPTSTVSVGDVGAERTVTNVAAGRISGTSTDAINGSQLFATNTAIENLSTTVTNNKTKYYSVNSTGGGNLNNDGATGADAIASGKDAAATGASAVSIGLGSTASEANSVALGAGSQTTAAVATLSGVIGGKTYTYAGGTPVGVVSVGSAGQERQIQNVAAGQVTASSTDAINGSQLYATNQTISNLSIDVVNNKTHYYGVNDGGIRGANYNDDGATGVNSVAAGVAASAAGAGAVAAGPGASAANANSTAVGAGASATVDDGVAIGSGSAANTKAGVAGYVASGATAAQTAAVAATTSTLGAVSVGDAANGEFRQITGVAAGSVNSDAVNVAQLKSVQTQLGTKIDGAVMYDVNIDGSRKNSVTLVGGDLNQPVVIRNVAQGKAPTDAVNVAQLTKGLDQTLVDARTYTDNSSRTTLAQANNYTDQKFNQLNGDISEVRGEARQAAAIGLAAASLRYDDRPGKLSAAVGAGLWRSEGALAFGLGYTNEDGRLRSNISATTSGGHWGAAAGLSYTFN